MQAPPAFVREICVRRCKGMDSFWDVQAGGVIWMVSK